MQSDPRRSTPPHHHITSSRVVVASGLPLEIALAFFDPFHGLLRGLFEHDEPGPGLGQGAEEFVELALGGRLFPTLGVLDDEHHGQGHGRGRRFEGDDPPVRKTENSAHDHGGNEKGAYGTGHHGERAVVIDAIEPAAPHRALFDPGGDPITAPPSGSILFRR
jgi:hypothetical protein